MGNNSLEILDSVKKMYKLSAAVSMLDNVQQTDDIQRLTSEIIDYLKPLANEPFHIKTEGTGAADVFDNGIIQVANSITYETTGYYREKYKHLVSRRQLLSALAVFGDEIVQHVRKSVAGDISLMVAILRRSMIFRGEGIKIKLPDIQFSSNIYDHDIGLDMTTDYLLAKSDEIYLCYHENADPQDVRNNKLWHGEVTDWELFVQIHKDISDAIDLYIKKNSKILKNAKANEDWVVDALEKIANTKRMEARLLE